MMHYLDLIGKDADDNLKIAEILSNCADDLLALQLPKAGLIMSIICELSVLCTHQPVLDEISLTEAAKFDKEREEK